MLCAQEANDKGAGGGTLLAWYGGELTLLP